MSYLRDVATQIRAEVAPELVPPSSDSLFLMYATLARAKGTEVTSEDVHDAWVVWMEMRGEDHAAMLPFADLPSDVQAADLPFVEAIRTVAGRLGRS